jgi:hypothetical protein
MGRTLYQYATAEATARCPALDLEVNVTGESVISTQLVIVTAQDQFSRLNQWSALPSREYYLPHILYVLLWTLCWSAFICLIYPSPTRDLSLIKT